MFGYVIPDKPNMFVKDFVEYKAYYCGICKCIGKKYGQLLRFSTNYDITFLSVFLHSVLDKKPSITEQRCVLSAVKKPIANTDKITELTVDINTLLTYYKLKDNIADSGGIFKKIADRLFFRRKYKKAAKNHSELDMIMKAAFDEIFRLEQEKCQSIDMLADPFAGLLRDTAKYALGEKFSTDIGDLMYNVGRWIYIMDAVDDIEDDAKEKTFNPFLIDYQFLTREKFVEDKGAEAEFLLMGAYNRIKQAFDKIDTPISEGVLTNILWYGILMRTKDILGGCGKCKKIRI